MCPLCNAQDGVLHRVGNARQKDRQELLPSQLVHLCENHPLLRSRRCRQICGLPRRSALPMADWPKSLYRWQLLVLQQSLLVQKCCSSHTYFTCWQSDQVCHSPAATLAASDSGSAEHYAGARAHNLAEGLPLQVVTDWATVLALNKNRHLHSFWKAPFTGLWERVHKDSTFQKVKAHMTKGVAEQNGQGHLWLANSKVDIIAQQTLQKSQPSKPDVADIQVQQKTLQGYLIRVAKLLGTWPPAKQLVPAKAGGTCWAGLLLGSFSQSGWRLGGFGSAVNASSPKGCAIALQAGLVCQ